MNFKFVGLAIVVERIIFLSTLFAFQSYGISNAHGGKSRAEKGDARYVETDNKTPIMKCRTEGKKNNDKGIEFKCTIKPKASVNGELQAFMWLSVKGPKIKEMNGTGISLQGKYVKTEKEETTTYRASYQNIIKELKINHLALNESKVLIALTEPKGAFEEVVISCAPEPQK